MLFLKNTANLKDANEPWKRVFIKKDLHPVYVKENNRIRKKMYALKQDPANNNKIRSKLKEVCCW